jgi:hypothetical protein
MKRGLAYALGTLALSTLLVACVGATGSVASRYATMDQSLPAGSRTTWNFDDLVPGVVPAGLQMVSGTWAVRAEADAPSPQNALCETGTAVWPVLLLGDDVYSDLDLSVRFKPIAGREDQAAGLLFRAQDGANYFVTRANALENNVRLYTMRNDNRTEIAGADRPVANGAWHELAVEVRGDRIRVAYDGEWIIERRDSTFSAGRIGLWTKSDSQSCFDDVQAMVPG